MRVHEFILLRDEGNWQSSPEWLETDREIREAAATVVWPPGAKEFSINPTPQGNGVKPIKEAFLLSLSGQGWRTEQRVKILDRGSPGKIDALKDYPDGTTFVVEWETGNVSSSHRALNKIVVAMKEENIQGGALIVPRRQGLYKYVTDRIGNEEELRPYFALWAESTLGTGLLGIYVIDYDKTDPGVPLISKGTDGRALV
ncbi:MAG: restriction endonuclease [Actinobacteria bacterium]|nr:restriction endonuclease [Actinomycetota bacterium]